MDYKEKYTNEATMVSEDIVSRYTLNTRGDITQAITGDELLRRLKPRLKELFK